MDAAEAREIIQSVLMEATDEEYNFFPEAKRIKSFDDAGVLTTDQGIIVTMNDGSEFQLAVVQSR